MAGFIKHAFREMLSLFEPDMKKHSIDRDAFRFVAVMGDRAANEARARELALDDSQVLFSQPCAAHGFHNIMKALCQKIGVFSKIIADARGTLFLVA